MSRSPVLPFAVVVVALVALSPACSSNDDDNAADSTTTSIAAARPSNVTESTETTETTTSATTLETTTSIPAAPDAISVAVYWTRFSGGTAEPIDIPVYRDEPDKPYPYVLYGSVTNAGGKSLAQPKVTVDWYANGGSIHQLTVAVLDAHGVALDHLDPGAVGDLLVVVDAPVADQLTDAQPSFGLAQL